MDFVANSKQQVQEMLETLGVSSIEELFSEIPEQLRRARPENDDGLSEYEGMQLMRELGARNRFSAYDSYLGAGAYEHHVPALVSAVCQKSEFLTAYTPYQAEASQGMLQAIFEFQSAVCAITGLEVANASLYDAASACAEALLMALRLQRKRKGLVIRDGLHPHYRAVVDAYLRDQDCTFEEDINENCAAVLVQYPDILGNVHDLRAISEECRAKGVLLIVCANPLVYGLFRSAAELGADIAIGDLQPLGIALQYGGPYAGYIACRKELVRQLPGRLVGETVDGDGRRGYTLTLQAREQHIRRDKATSNICSNQALAAMAALVASLWYGPQGLHELAKTNHLRAMWLRKELLAIPGIAALNDAACFNEFALTFSKPLDEVVAAFRAEKILPGVRLTELDPALPDALLVAVTECKSIDQLKRYVAVAKEIMQ